MSRGATGSSVGGQAKPALRLFVYLVLVVLLGSLDAVIGNLLHPEIPYLDHEHLIQRGVTVFVAVALFGTLEA